MPRPGRGEQARKQVRIGGRGRRGFRCSPWTRLSLTEARQRQVSDNDGKRHAKGCLCEIAAVPGKEKKQRRHEVCGGGVERKGKESETNGPVESLGSRRKIENWEGAERLERICPVCGLARWGKPSPKRPAPAQCATIVSVPRRRGYAFAAKQSYVLYPRLSTRPRYTCALLLLMLMDASRPMWESDIALSR
ncbi:hypothetical protein BT67DRAFT_72785 [Trichocladium antarcticum]|uniref:Uncharacterized protein n=1 Tax=Trichocladium antarcticum TaxID=1450529 RepID=A0AAN6UHL1_9PEZI|nr:hypothetical protein BT67DRAFT_72785 [Trichocladium antarcticum]